MISNAAFTELRVLLKNGQADKARELLLGLQAGYLTLLDEVRHLRLRVKNYEALINLEDRLVLKNNLLWIKDNTGLQGPFCPMCHTTDNSLIRLEKQQGRLSCPSCEASFSLKEEHTAQDVCVVLPFRKTRKKLGL